MSKPAIVLATYNRPKGLKRVLDSIINAAYDDYKNISLIISIDKSNNQLIYKLSKEFCWPYGEKIIIAHDHRLGLKNHFIRCGDLTEEYDSIIFLEDDLYLSPYYYKFATQAIDFYNNEQKVAGISLYSIKLNESARRAFVPVHDGFDVFFAQIPSWGPIWNREQWNYFKNWLSQDIQITEDDHLPLNVLKWPESSFKKYYFKYISVEKKYFVYPRISLATNFCDKGEHYINKSNVLQVPILLGEKKFQFSNFSDSNAIYDSFLEILPECLVKKNNKLKNYNFEVDLYGIKSIHKINKKYVLTSKKSRESILSFARELYPHETGILMNCCGNDFLLCKKKNIISNKLSFSRKLKDIYYDVQFISIIKVLLSDLNKIVSRINTIFMNKFKIKRNMY